MNALLTRAGALFLAPAASAGRPAVVTSAPRLAVVLASEDDLPTAAGGVAAALRRAGRARSAVVCRPGTAWTARPAAPAASRLARRLAAREVVAHPAGSLCRVALPSDPADAVRDTWRLVGVADVPVVVALPGRLDGFDGLLAQADHLYLASPADADEILTMLALGSLERLGPPVTRLAVPGGAIARRAAAIGMAALPLDPLVVEAT